MDWTPQMNNAHWKPTLKWRLGAGEGEIGNLENFRELPSLLRMDVLQDWICDLKNEYNLAHDELWRNADKRRVIK